MAQHDAGQDRIRTTAIIAVLVTALLGLSVVRAPVASAAVASKIAPAAAAVGTGITIAGELLSDTTGVTFLGSVDPGDEVAAENFIALEPKKLVVQIPAGAQTGPIEVTGPDGAVVTPVPLTVYQQPSITSLSSPSGKPDDVLTITGANLMGAKAGVVTFGAKKATLLTGSTQTEVQVKVPGGLPGGPVPMSLTTTGGIARGTFYISPAVKAIAPATGTTAGGTIASITGAGFTGVESFVDDPATAGVDESLDGVTIGGTRVTRLIAVSDKEVVVEVPPGTDPAAPVVVKTTQDGVVGVSGNVATFAYRPLPTVTAVSKNWNAVNDPSEVVYTGVNLTDSTVVTFGAIAATGAVVDTNAGTLTVTPPVGTKAAVTAVTFTNTLNGLSHKVSVPFAYVAAPALTKLAPLTGPEGTTVTLTGTNFGSGTRVFFGATQATDCKLVSFLVITCKAPAGADTVDVTVDNGIGTSPVTLVTTFTYTVGTPPTVPVVGLPVVAPLIPAYGATGTTVDLRGANVHTITKVEFTGDDNTWAEAPEFLVPLPGRLVVRVPAAARTGEIRVTSPAGVVTTIGRVFTKTVRPTIDSIDAVGDTSFGVTPGDLLTIKGSGLIIPKAKSFVSIGGKPAPILTKPIPNPKTIVVRVPPSVGSREVVEIVTPLGNDAAEMTAYQIPEIKSIKPISYSRTGGTVVTIAGVNFTGVDNLTVGVGRLGAVTFGGVPAAKLVFVNDKTLVATTAAGSASADELVVTTQQGDRFGTSSGRTRSVDTPIAVVSSVSPATGPTAVTPPVVTITGQHLKTTSIVKFGTSLATVQSAAGDGSSMVVVPPVRGEPGTVDISITNYDDDEALTTTVTEAYTYLLQPAVITSLSTATALPGTPLTISGTGFVDVTSVSFGAVEVPYTVTNDTTILTEVPATPSGDGGVVVDVTVVNATGQPSSGDPETADDWTWDQSPTLTSLSASTGNMGTTVTINGSNFVGVTRVRFGYTNATSYTVVNSNTITAVVPQTPAGAGGMTVDLVVEIGLSVSQPVTATADNWTWVAPATINAMSQNTAPAGTTVTVTGTGFVGVYSVTMNNKPVTSYNAVSSTTLTFVVPPPDASGGASPGRNTLIRIYNGSGRVSTAVPTTADDWLVQ